MPTDQAIDSIKTLSRAMTLLDKLLDSDLPLGVNELAKQCNMNPSTAYRILKTLMQNAWVYQCEDERYIVGPRFSFASERKDFYFALKEISAFTMNRITAEESQAMNLAVRKNNACVILQQSRTSRLIDLIPPINSILPFHASACGKILLAGLPDPLLKIYMDNLSYKRYTQNTITDRVALAHTIEKVRRDGYALDRHESLGSAFCIAVPVLKSDGETIAALSFSGFMGAFEEKVLNYYLPVLRSAAAEISNNVFNVYLT